MPHAYDTARLRDEVDKLEKLAATLKSPDKILLVNRTAEAGHKCLRALAGLDESLKSYALSLAALRNTLSESEGDQN